MTSSDATLRTRTHIKTPSMENLYLSPSSTPRSCNLKPSAGISARYKVGLGIDSLQVEEIRAHSASQGVPRIEIALLEDDGIDIDTSMTDLDDEEEERKFRPRLVRRLQGPRRQSRNRPNTLEYWAKVRASDPGGSTTRPLPRDVPLIEITGSDGSENCVEDHRADMRFSRVGVENNRLHPGSSHRAKGHVRRRHLPLTHAHQASRDYLGQFSRRADDPAVSEDGVSHTRTLLTNVPNITVTPPDLGISAQTMDGSGDRLCCASLLHPFFRVKPSQSTKTQSVTDDSENDKRTNDAKKYDEENTEEENVDE